MKPEKQETFADPPDHVRRSLAASREAWQRFDEARRLMDDDTITEGEALRVLAELYIDSQTSEGGASGGGGA